MDPFSIAAGVVGLMASIDSIISLCKRLAGMLEGVGRDEQTRMILNVEIYQQLKLIAAQPDTTLTPNQCHGLMISNQTIYSRLCKLHTLLFDKSLFSVGTGDKVRSNLDKVDALVRSAHILVTLPRPSTDYRNAGLEEEEEDCTAKKVFMEIMDFKNRKPITKRDLIANNIYSQQKGIGFPVDVLEERLLETGEGVFFVESIPVGTTPKVKASRLNRIGRLILVSKHLESDLGLTRMEKMVEQDGTFYILSRVEGCHSKSTVTTLEHHLGKGFDNCHSVLLSLAAAVAGLHDCHIVHESINSRNILLIGSTDIKLAGFLLARIADPLEMSERERPGSDPHYELRRRIYQAPERIAGSRYSFECDIYSLGVVMAEVKLGKSFLLEDLFNGHTTTSFRESILNLLEPFTDGLTACIRDCMADDASSRPVALEVYSRLERV